MIYGGIVTAFGAVVMRALALRTGDKRLSSLSVSLSALTFLFVTVAFLLLTYYFLTSDFSNMYVWSYSSSDLPTVYKLSGVWAGASGSFLLWTWLMALVLVTEVVLEPRRRYLSGKFHGVFQIALAGIVLMFLLIVVGMDVFEPTGAALLNGYPDGYGLKLVLQTPEMVVHPPVVFAGYAFCVAAFAAGAAYYVTSDKNWPKISLPWARLGWLFLTLGIGIGAIWAYYVLGWGGYWAWDPVETSSLLPWVIATAFLHTQVRHIRKGEYAILSPVLGMLSFVAVIFATFATRAGGLWASSVHSFGTAEGASAGARLSFLLQNDSTVLGIFTIMLMLFAVSIFLAYSKHRSSPRPVEQAEPDRFSEYISDKNNMLLTVLLFVITSAVMLILLFKNVNASQSANYAEFNQKMSLFFVALMVAMTICLVWKFSGKQRALWLGTGVIATSLVLSIAASASGYDWLVTFSLPSYILGVGASVLRLSRSRATGSIRATIQKVSPHLVHLAVALVLLSFVVSSNLQQYPDSSGNITTPAGQLVSVGGEMTVGDYTIQLASVSTTSAPAYSGGSMVTDLREAVINVSRSGHVLREGVELTDKYGPSAQGGVEVMDIEVYVYKAIARDLYISFQWRDNDSAYIEAKTIPLMNVLWAGFGLLAVGIVLRTFTWQQEPKEEPEPRRAPKVEPKEGVEDAGGAAPAGESKDYESIVEEELRRFKEKRAK